MLATLIGFFITALMAYTFLPFPFNWIGGISIVLIGGYITWKSIMDCDDEPATGNPLNGTDNEGNPLVLINQEEELPEKDYSKNPHIRRYQKMMDKLTLKQKH